VPKNVERFRRNRDYNEDEYEFFYEKKKTTKKPSRKAFYNEDYYDNEYQKTSRKRYRRQD
jgi:hypothetical protein